LLLGCSRGDFPNIGGVFGSVHPHRWAPVQGWQTAGESRRALAAAHRVVDGGDGVAGTVVGKRAGVPIVIWGW
jgi:hypothetical protein